MTPQAKAQIEEHLLDAIAANHEQSRLLHNPTPEVDSALEHLARAYRLSSGDCRAHVGDAIRLVVEAWNLNDDRENPSQRAVMPLLSDRSWGVKSAANALRPVLADLSNRLISGARRAAVEQQLVDLLDVIPLGLLMVGDDVRPALAHELRVAKSTTLRAAILARREMVS